MIHLLDRKHFFKHASDSKRPFLQATKAVASVGSTAARSPVRMIMFESKK
jgi:hypothetical protein